MFNAEPKTLAKLKPHIERVLVVDPYAASTRILYDLLKNMGAGDVETTTRSSHGLEIAESFNPQLVLTELEGTHVDGPLFTKRLRRSECAARHAPVIVITAEATAEKIKAARDSGAHEFLRKPFKAGDLFRRVENVSLKPRPWVEGVMYVGPDRRRFNSGDYAGPRKRRSDGKATGPRYAERVDQALKVLSSAMLQAHLDPAQAQRSMQAQLEELSAVALHAGDPRLVRAVAGLDRYVTALGRGYSPDQARALDPDFNRLTAAAADAGEALDRKAG